MVPEELEVIGRTVDVTQTDGPFRVLENHWKIVPDGDGSKVDVSLTYEFRSRILATLMGSMFDAAFRRFTQAFEARADAVYGTGASS